MTNVSTQRDAGTVPAIAVGCGLRNPRVERVELDDRAQVDALALALHLHDAPDAWWTPSTFEGRRAQATWRGARVLAVDVDHSAAHRGGAWRWRDRLRAHRALRRAPGTLAHATPRGLRVVVLLDEEITDAAVFARASRALCERVGAWLAHEKLDGLTVDTAASCDRARLLYAPRATIDGHARRARVVSGAAGVVALDELCVVALDGNEPATVAPTARGAAPARDGHYVIVAGARNNTLTSLAGSMRRRGMSEAAILGALKAENRERCDPPLNEREVERIARSVARYQPEPYSDPNSVDGSAAGACSLVETAWPDPLDGDAFHGLAGEIVRAIEPQTEADPAAMLVQLFAGFGSAIGNRPHFVADGARHGCKLFVAIVGATSKGRKGTSWERAREPLTLADPEWSQRVVSGLSSGEGLIWPVRDAIYRKEKNKKTGEIEDVLVDEGVDDKRLLVFEPELASTMAVMARQGSTLSAIIRDAWDRSELRSLTKNSPAQSTGAHVSIIGHVTRNELRRSLDRTELGNGFANRFLWIFAKRARVLPFGGEVVELEQLATRLNDSIVFARETDAITWADDARPIWADVYADLSGGRTGILGAVTARGEAQVVRLAAIYALLDRSREIGGAHLRAALAVWKYSFASAQWVWGDALGDPIADELLALLRARPSGATATEIRDHFGKHRSAEVARAKGVLITNGLARRESTPTGGRPEERWFAVR